MIRLSERERRALSGLTPALARRLQRQLLAHLPPAAAGHLRRTLSLHEPPAAAPPAAAPAPPAAAPSPPAAPDAATYCTLPRLRRRDSTPDRPLLSKYLTPERASSLDEPSLDATRRSEPRRPADQPRRRVSRFLRSDFFDPTPSDESIYAKHRKEKELETQKVLREIREKKNRSLESPGVRSPTNEYGDATLTIRDEAQTRKCLSPVSGIAGKERSRSITPFFPILDNIKETATDAIHGASTIKKKYSDISDMKTKPHFEENSLNRESKLVRPKSYPVKNVDSVEDSTPMDNSNKENDAKEKLVQKESKLMRPKSYPTSSPSPEKVFINRNTIQDKLPVKEEDVKGDIEVSFSITLPKKKGEIPKATDTIGSKTNDMPIQNIIMSNNNDKQTSDNLLIKKYKIVNNDINEKSIKKLENGSVLSNEVSKKEGTTSCNDKSSSVSKKEVTKQKSIDDDSTEKKGTIKKKIIRKVSSKSKTDLGNSQNETDNKVSTEKKKVTKKIKEKVSDDVAKTSSVPKKKSVLQSIGHKLEKLASNKSNSPEKVPDSTNSTVCDPVKLKRMQREQSVPVSVGPPTESNLIKRAVTLTDVAALDVPTNSSNTSSTKTTVSKVLGLFKKFDPKDKTTKTQVDKQSLDENIYNIALNDCKSDKATDQIVSDNLEQDKPRRPTSLLLNGLSRKNKYGRTASDSVSVASIDNDDVLKKETEPKNIRNTLKLDFSRLPRVKKIVPTNPVIEPQIVNHYSGDKMTDQKEIGEKTYNLTSSIGVADNLDAHSRSRSRSRSTISNSELKSDLSTEGKTNEKHSISPSDISTQVSLRNRESMSPEKEDIVDRIRRKSFYSRFNEKKQRRKSSLVGPGATEYDPLSRIHSPPVETKYDASPTSPSTYDLSPGFSITSDISPSSERYRSLLTDVPVNNRNTLRYDNYGLNDKIDTYRSLDRNELRKYPGSRRYLDYDQPLSYGTQRYSITKSLLESNDGPEDSSLGLLRDPHKYNRTISMYSPGSYATYRPKRTRNSAIILKESEKEPSPENILEKIRQRKKISISVTRKPDLEKDPTPRSNVSPKGESDRAECSAKTD